MKKKGKDQLRPREIIGLLLIALGRVISWILGVLACALYVIDIVVGGLLILAGLAVAGKERKINMDAISSNVVDVWEKFN